MEAVFEDLDADGKGEFPEVRDAIKKRKLRHVGLERKQDRLTRRVKRLRCGAAAQDSGGPG